jgi:hypothetical protein
MVDERYVRIGESNGIGDVEHQSKHDNRDKSVRDEKLPVECRSSWLARRLNIRCTKL